MTSHTWTIAASLASEGYHVFPLGKWDAEDGAHKAPLPGSRGHLDATNDPEVVKRWAREFPDNNYGIACGPSDLLVVDMDVKGDLDGITDFDNLSRLLDGSARPHYENFYVDTPSGGRHFYFRGAQRSTAKLKKKASIDIKSDGGYVVGPACRAPDGDYRLNGAKRPKRTPDWIKAAAAKAQVDLSSVSTDKQISEAELRKVLDALPADEMTYSEWVEPFMAVRACHVIDDQGEELSDGEKIALLDEWSARDGRPDQYLGFEAIQSKYDAVGDEGALTIATLIHKAKANGYTPPAPAPDPSRFDGVKGRPPAVETPEKDPRGRFYSYLSFDDEAEEVGDTSYLIDQVIPKKGIGFLYAPPESFKTFAVVDICKSVLHGDRWAPGKDHGGFEVTKPGDVLYITGEDADGARRRFKAWTAAFPDRPRKGKFAFLPRMPLLTKAEDVNELLLTLQSLPWKPDLIVVDTVFRAMAAGNAAEQQDTSAFTHALDTLRDAFDCFVLGVAHTAKAASGDIYGSVVFRANADVMLRVERKDQGDRPAFEIVMDKLRGDAYPPKVAMIGRPVELEGHRRPLLVFERFEGTMVSGGGRSASKNSVASDANRGARMRAAFEDILRRSGGHHISRNEAATLIAERLVQQGDGVIYEAGEEDDPVRSAAARKKAVDNKRTSVTKWLGREAAKVGSLVQRSLIDADARDDTGKKTWYFRCPADLLTTNDTIH